MLYILNIYDFLQLTFSLKIISSIFRMFTSRSEFRISFRPENADLRLTEKGYFFGLVSKQRFDKMVRTKNNLTLAINLLKDFKMNNNKWREKLKMPAVKSNFEKRYTFFVSLMKMF